MMFTSLMRRPTAAAQKEGATNRYAMWPDTLGLDSAYDYDPVWAGVNPDFFKGTAIEKQTAEYLTRENARQ